MRISSFAPLLGVALLACAQSSFSVDASVKITAPAPDAKLDAMAENRIVYEVVPGPMGDHTHLYVDTKEVAVLRQLKSSYPLTGLSPGPHALCIKVVNKAHTPIGIEQCVKVSFN